MTKAPARCSFCGKRQDRTRRLFYPPPRTGGHPASDAAICAQCVKEFWVHVKARPDLYGIPEERTVEEEALYEDERDELSWEEGKTK